MNGEFNITRTPCGLLCGHSSKLILKGRDCPNKYKRWRGRVQGGLGYCHIEHIVCLRYRIDLKLRKAKELQWYHSVEVEI